MGAVAYGAGTQWSPPAGAVGSTRAERRRARESAADDTGPIERVVDDGPAPFSPGPSAAGATRWTPDMSSGSHSFSPAGRDSGFGPAGGGAGFGPAGGDGGFGPAGGDGGFGPAGSGASFGSVGGDAGLGPVKRDSGFGPAGGNAGFGPEGRDSGPGTGPLDRMTDTGPLGRDSGPGTGPVGRVTDTGPVGRVSDSGSELYGALRESADRREAGDGTAVEPRWHRRRAAEEPVAAEEEVAFDPGDTGTWKVRGVVPGADGGRRNTTILRYLLGLLAVDHVRALTRWAFAVPVVGLVLLLVKPRWIGLAVIVLGLLLIAGRLVAVRLIERRTLPRRYRPVEDDLRAAVEAGKANLRGELRRVGMPSSALAISRSAVRSGSSDSRSDDRSRLRDIEIDRVLPRAQLDRALRVLDGATAGR
ncbi:MAG TPA: hypothetical protein VI357_04390 [Mycobacteriales bacterium]